MPSSLSPRVSLGHWYLLFVRPSHEIALASLLHNHSVTYFLPSYATERKRSSKKTVQTLCPLFKQYFFAFSPPLQDERTPLPHRIRALLANNPKQRFSILSIHLINHPRIYRDLCNLQQVLNDPPQASTFSPALCPLTAGQSVQVQAPHKLAGLEGIVLPDKQDPNSLYINVPVMNQAVRVNIHRHFLVAI